MKERKFCTEYKGPRPPKVVDSKIVVDGVG